MAANPRRKSVVVHIGNAEGGRVKVGGNHPIVVQSMTNTDTADGRHGEPGDGAGAAGSELVRVTVNTEHAAARCPDRRDGAISSARACPSSATSTTTATSC